MIWKLLLFLNRKPWIKERFYANTRCKIFVKGYGSKPIGDEETFEKVSEIGITNQKGLVERRFTELYFLPELAIICLKEIVKKQKFCDVGVNIVNAERVFFDLSKSGNQSVGDTFHQYPTPKLNNWYAVQSKLKAESAKTEVKEEIKTESK